MSMFDNGVFGIPGPEGQVIRCEVLFTYQDDNTGRCYVVYMTGEGEGREIGANRYAEREDGQTELFPIETEAERDLLAHCFEDLKQKLQEQAAAEEAGSEG